MDVDTMTLDEFIEYNSWPRRADGAPVMIGDELWDEVNNLAYTVDLMTYDDDECEWFVRDALGMRKRYRLEGARRFDDLTPDECRDALDFLLSKNGGLLPNGVQTIRRLLERIGVRIGAEDGD